MNDSGARKLERIFRSVLKLPNDADVRSASMDLDGWDSIAHLNLILAVEQDFRVTFSPEEAAGARSFDAMSQLIDQCG